MTEQEIINQNIQRQIDAQNARIDNVLTKVDMLVTEMRDRDNQRAAEIMELRQKHDADTKEMNQRFYATFDAMDAKIDRLGDKIQTLVITAIVGFGAILVAVISAMK